MRIANGQEPPLAAPAQKVEYSLNNTDGVVLSFAFHLIRKESDQDTPFSPVNLRDMNERIIIFLYQAEV